MLSTGRASRRSLRTSGSAVLSTFPDDVVHLHRWSAHTTDVTTLELISDPQSLVTSSSDGRVRVWSPSGELLGQLDTPEHESKQIERRVLKMPAWKFAIDSAALEQAKLDQAVQVIAEVEADSGSESDPEGQSATESKARSTVSSSRRTSAAPSEIGQASHAMTPMQSLRAHILEQVAPANDSDDEDKISPEDLTNMNQVRVQTDFVSQRALLTDSG